ncbi:MAG: hypothetical protein NZ805_16490, partial [Armatimonadetes bacterium]|nr:hypothetical protein [Armatimonadota bacterium]MDW8030195.1 hypothetical protein [Armatimonadota bacterium]
FCLRKMLKRCDALLTRILSSCGKMHLNAVALDTTGAIDVLIDKDGERFMSPNFCNCWHCWQRRGNCHVGLETRKFYRADLLSRERTSLSSGHKF